MRGMRNWADWETRTQPHEDAVHTARAAPEVVLRRHGIRGRQFATGIVVADPMSVEQDAIAAAETQTVTSAMSLQQQENRLAKGASAPSAGD